MLLVRGECQRLKLGGRDGVDVGTVSRLSGGKGERGREEGVQLVLPQSDRQPAAQRVEEVCLALYFSLPLKIESE